MELFSLHCPPAVTRLPSSSSWRRAAMEKPTSFVGQAISFPSKSNRRPDARNPGSLDFRPRASGSTQVATGSSPKSGEAIKQEMSSKDDDLVFVAGATGRVGSRTVRELLRLGFRVRAGVRSAQKAETLVQSVRRMKLDDVTGSLETQPVEKLEIVECDLENQSSILPAIGKASIVICCIGASEKEVFDVTGPYRIDYKATKNLIEEATFAKVDHFILLTSLGTNKIGFPASILNLFWGVLIWKRKAEEALIASGLPYTIVRPGGMERPTDSYKETHNIVLANEDTYFGGQVSNLQVAELMAFMAKHRRLSFCKVVEVIAETTAPLTPMKELLAKIPSQRELPAEPKPDPVPVRVEPEPTASVVEKEIDQMEVLKTKPLSPYTMYEDLKPPTSPTPTPSSASNGLNDKPVIGSPSLESNKGNDAAGTTPIIVNEEEIPQISPQNSSHQSPYYVYDDLKPPTSPSPNAPSTGSSISTSAGDSNPTTSTNNISQTSTREESGAQQHSKQQTSRPLSPYTMYEDLKPPSSPLPSMPKY